MKSRMEYAVGLDLGGTNMVCAVVSSGGRIVFRKKIPTLAGRGRSALLSRMSALSQDCVAQSGVSPGKIKGLGIGAAGVIDHTKGIVRISPNLPELTSVNISEYF